MATFWFFLPASLFGGLWDLKYRKVPNVLNLGILLAALAWHGSRGEAYSAALGAAAGLAPLLVPYFLGGMGAGDVKFMTALGAAAAWPLAADLVLWAALSGGLLVLALVLKPADWREAWLAFASGGKQGFKALYRTAGTKRKEKVPYALAMSAGFILCHFIPLARGVLTQ